MTTPLPRPIPTPAGEPPQASDADLAVRAGAGDRGAFELIMRRHNRRLFRLARSLVRSDEEAEDVLQEAYLRDFARLSDLASGGGRSRPGWRGSSPTRRSGVGAPGRAWSRSRSSGPGSRRMG